MLDGEGVTPERVQHGDIEIVRVPVAEEDGKVREYRVHSDSEVRWLDKAVKDGKLEPRQAAAGDRYEQLYRAVNGSPSPKSCLDWVVVGAGGPHDPVRVVRLRRALTEAQAVLSVQHQDILNRVLVMGEKTGDRRPEYRRWQLIVDGLKCLADLWGM